MIDIEIIREYKQCWHVGQRRAVADEFALMLIELGFAKRVEREGTAKTLDSPPRHKQVIRPDVAK